MHFEYLEARCETARVAVSKLDPSKIRICSKEESARLNAACPFFTFAVCGVERDGRPFNSLKRVRAPYVETAEGILRVQAAICYGARIDMLLLIRTEQPE
jgi:hypothetical protein